MSNYKNKNKHLLLLSMRPTRIARNHSAETDAPAISSCGSERSLNDSSSNNNNNQQQQQLCADHGNINDDAAAADHGDHRPETSHCCHPIFPGAVGDRCSCCCRRIGATKNVPPLTRMLSLRHKTTPTAVPSTSPSAAATPSKSVALHHHHHLPPPSSPGTTTTDGDKPLILRWTPSNLIITAVTSGMAKNRWKRTTAPPSQSSFNSKTNDNNNREPDLMSVSMQTTESCSFDESDCAWQSSAAAAAAATASSCGSSPRCWSLGKWLIATRCQKILLRLGEWCAEIVIFVASAAIAVLDVLAALFQNNRVARWCLQGLQSACEYFGAVCLATTLFVLTLRRQCGQGKKMMMTDRVPCSCSGCSAQVRALPDRPSKSSTSVRRRHRWSLHEASIFRRGTAPRAAVPTTVTATPTSCAASPCVLAAETGSCHARCAIEDNAAPACSGSAINYEY